MAVKLNSTGGGSVTLDSPSTASNYTVTLPSAAGTLATTTGTGSVFTNPTINGFTGDTSAITIGTTQFVKDTSGNIGIGTASPGQKVEIAVASGFGALQVSNTSDSNRGGRLVATGSAASGNFAVNSTSSGYSLTFGIDSFEKMRLDTSGNLGLGVTPSGSWGSPAFMLGKPGAVNPTYPFISSIDSQQIVIGSNSYWDGTNWKAAFAGSGVTAAQQRINYNQISWHIASAVTQGVTQTFTQAMTLDTSGNLLVGITSGSYNTIASNKSYSLIVQQTTAGNSVINIDGVYSSGTQNLIIFSKNGGTTTGTITYNGTNVLYNGTSDQRLKENIVDAPNALSSINAIKVRSFDWKSDGSHSEYGYIAQELLEVAPEAVHVPADPEEMMGVDFGKLTPRLVKAIQELSAQNQALEARLAKLEAK